MMSLKKVFVTTTIESLHFMNHIETPNLDIEFI